MHKNIVIIGGGLAGLFTAIHLTRAGVEVTLIEKDQYPKHKVCGEYISNEVLPYFDFLDIDIGSIHPVQVSKMQISTSKGKSIYHQLPLGGFGISRYTLDNFLYEIAKSIGAEIIKDQVISLNKREDYYHMQLGSGAILRGNFVVGCYGKRSVLDRNLSRNFHQKKSPWLAVKAHYRADFDPDLVALHNFEGGYCGLSMVENDKVNACYLVHYESFKRFKDIESFQKEILYKNVHLRDFFEKSSMLFEKPITIGQINFSKKALIENGVLMVGDSSGLIHPLCGNGMAMAIQAGKIISELLIRYEKREISVMQLEKLYSKQWEEKFSKRLVAGRLLQSILLNPYFQDIAYRTASFVPGIVPGIIKQTHGKPIVCT